MLKIVFFWIGRIMLAGAYGWKKSSESFPAIIGATIYFVFWMLCLFLFDKNDLFSILFSIALPLIYGLFVLIIRLKEHKKQELDKNETIKIETAPESSTIDETQIVKEFEKKDSSFSILKDDIKRKNSNEKILKSRKFNISSIILAVTLAILTIVFCVFFYVQDNKINELNEKISSLNITIKKKDASINIAEKTIDELNKELEEWKKLCSNATLDLYFYENYAACVNENSKYYHTHDCKYFDKSYFYIYNKELAELNGYEPCHYCRWDTEGD